MCAGTVRYWFWFVVAAPHKCKDELFIFSKEEKRTLGSSSNGIGAFFIMKLNLEV
jgi:hypothetical protein